MTLKRLGAAGMMAALCITFWPASADAQRRAVVRVQPAPAVVVGGGYYRPYYGPYYRPYVYGSWGIYGSWGYPSPWYGPSPYPYYYAPGYVYDGGSVRLQVTPKTAQVFVDGYFAGTVDEFDGAFQRLRVEPGEHEFAIFADGFHTLHQRLYLQPLGSLTIKEALQPLQPGEVQEPRPTPPPSARATAPATRRAPAVRLRDEPQQDREDPPPAVTPDDASSGTVSILVQPGGADVLIDGERWEGPDGNERLLVQLTPGSHRLEIRRSGYQTFSRTIDIRPGQTATLNVSLSRQ